MAAQTGWLQGLLSQLTSMGFEAPSYSDLGSITPEQISQKMYTAHGLTGQDLPSSLFQSFDLSQLRSALPQTYSPQVETAGIGVDRELMKQYESKATRDMFGGFAGTYGGQNIGSQMRDVKSAEMIEPIVQQRQQALAGQQEVSDLVASWQNIVADLTT
jgi:hypothetical protein